MTVETQQETNATGQDDGAEEFDIQEPDFDSQFASDPDGDDNDDPAVDAAGQRDEADPADRGGAESDDSGDDVPSDRKGGDDDSAAGRGDDEAGLSDQLVARARDAGLTDAELRQVTPEGLETLLRLHDRHVASLGRQQSRDADEGGTAAAPADSKPADSELKLEIDEDLVDPDVASGLQSIVNHVNTVVGELRSRLAEHDSFLTQSRESALFDSLSGAEKAIYGSGAKISDEQRTNREKVRGEMEAIRVGYKHLGRDMPPEHDLLDRATRSLFSDQLREHSERHLANQLRNRRGQFMKRPGGERSGPRSPEESAFQKLSAKIAEMGGGGEEEFFEEDFE